MNCDDYLSMLSTLPVEELAYGHAREHAATCRDCDRVTRVVAERERNMLMAFGDVHSSLPAERMAANAIRASRRRKVAIFNRIGIGVAVAGTLLTLIALRLFPTHAPTPTVAQRFRLQCLSPAQAAEIVRPTLGQTGKLWLRPDSPLGLLDVETSPETMEKVRSLLDKYDSPTQSQCGVQLTVPKVPTTP